MSKQQSKYVVVHYLTNNNKAYTFRTFILNLRPDELLITESGSVVKHAGYVDKPTNNLNYKWIAGRVPVTKIINEFKKSKGE
jgi:hypothetical protein